MKLEPYWLASAPHFTAGAAGPVDGRADVVVVGGGFCGLSAALHLARRGVDVVLLDAGRVIGEASGRNGGHVNNGLSVDFAGVAERFGLERAKEMYRAFDAAVDTVERVQRDEVIDCDFRRSGKLKLAAKPTHIGDVERAYALLAEHVDRDCSFLRRDQLATEIGSESFHAGIVMRRSGQMHVGRFGVGLAHAAAKHGARIYQHAVMQRIDREPGGGFVVTSARGVIRAAQVFLATGASRIGPLGWIRRRVVPIGSFIIVTEPLGRAVIDSIMPGRRNCTTSLYVGHYFRTTADDRLVFGGRARFALSDPESDRKSGDVLRADLARIFPQLRNPPIAYCWGGLVDMTSDRLPRAGTRNGIHFATGFSGHGVQMSTHMGAVMAARIMGDDVANPFRDMPWPAIPGHFGPPWFLPLIGVYYRWKDRRS